MNPFMQTASGKAFDLVEPQASMVDFSDVAEHLAKIARFAGATPGQFYSVAEHCVRAAEAIYDRTQDESLAAYALLHDAHEAYIVDRITPERWAFHRIAEKTYGAAAARVADELAGIMRHHIDQAIHEAAGIIFPLPYETVTRIKHIDLVMLATERRDLMRPTDHRWAQLDGIDPLPERIAPASWPEAWRQYRDAAKRFLPALRT